MTHLVVGNGYRVPLPPRRSKYELNHPVLEGLHEPEALGDPGCSTSAGVSAGRRVKKVAQRVSAGTA